MAVSITVVIPFYKGNAYLQRLFRSIRSAAEATADLASWDVVVVNDSPDVPVELPADAALAIKVIANPVNMGIQGARVNGLRHAEGEWVLFLDQDDELVAEGFDEQVRLTKNADVVVGNGVYHLGDISKPIYLNGKAMDYLIREERFLRIRNLIPSPGECLIRRCAVPSLWQEKLMKKNGADDWLLWLLLFRSGARFACNPRPVYVHNDTGGQNLSADLGKMRDSALEMREILSAAGILSAAEQKTLYDSIQFKYRQDTHRLTPKTVWAFRDAFFANVRYRLRLNTLR